MDQIPALFQYLLTTRCVIVSACRSPAAVSVRSLGSLGCQSAAFGIPGRSSRAPSYAGLLHWGQR